MNPQYFGLNAEIGRLVKAPGDQSRIIALAVALAVSSLAHLPSSGVNNVPAFYGEQVHPFVCEKISEVGEAVVFASKNALEYAQLFWKMRYNAAFPANVLVDQANAIESLLFNNRVMPDVSMLWAGGITMLSEEMALFITKYSREIMVVASRVAIILQPDPVVDTDDTVAG